MDREGPHQVVIERNLLIPMSDGAHLAADLYRPAGDGPFPAVFSYYPYHKDDMIGSMCERQLRYFAEHGYAGLLIDFRGLGSSDGIVHEAMDRGEGRDGAEAVEWIAEQAWCDGNVGMFGMSYGGITSFKTAAEQPPHLKAIVPLMGCTDIYLDYLYPGGCLNSLGAFGAWGSWMLAMNLMPPTLNDPEGRWYRVWQERLANGRPYVFPWLDHPEHDDYWESRAVDPERIKTPAFLIAGWRDIFPEPMVRAYEGITAPKKLWVGPWMHSLPELSPFEAIEYLPEMLRWWNRWLRDDDNGIAEEPPVTICVQGQRNTWRNERKWPIPRAKAVKYFLGPRRSLTTAAGATEGAELYHGRQSVGVAAGLWDPTGLGIGLPFDQSSDDLASLAFTSPALAVDTEISGSPEATIRVAIEAGDAVNLVAKLCDVAPDGHSSLITTGWLNTNHRNSHREAEPPPRGHPYDFRIQLWATSYLVPRGHRLRLSIACADFPRLWPTPSNPTIRLLHGGRRGSSVKVPVVPPVKAAPTNIKPADPSLRQLPPGSTMAPRYSIERDMVAGTTQISTGSQRTAPLPLGGTMDTDHIATASVSDSHPAGANVQGETKISVQLPALGRVEVHTTSWISRTGMTLTGRVTVDGREFFFNRWQK